MVGDLGKLNAAKGFKKLPKVQKSPKWSHCCSEIHTVDSGQEYWHHTFLGRNVRHHLHFSFCLLKQRQTCILYTFSTAQIYIRRSLFNSLRVILFYFFYLSRLHTPTHFISHPCAHTYKPWSSISLSLISKSVFHPVFLSLQARTDLTNKLMRFRNVSTGS